MASRRRAEWRAGVWPNVPPPRPALGFPGPVGLWDGGAFIAYELVEALGLIDDVRFRHPPPGSRQGQLEANERRFRIWEREEALGRGEVYLRLKKLDLDDVDHVLDFVSTFDVLDIRALDVRRIDRQWYGVIQEPIVPLGALLNYPGFGSRDHSKSVPSRQLRESVISTIELQRSETPTWLVRETLEEFRWGARAICDLHTAWTVLSGGADVREAVWRNPLVAGGEMESGEAEFQARTFLETTMRIALDGFSPRMWITDGEGNPAYGAMVSSAPSDVTLFEILVLELFRHIAEDAVFKTCENEMCRRTFVRQEGGSAHGQSRLKGVRYCSRLCAKAVSQRRYRQRHKRN